MLRATAGSAVSGPQYEVKSLGYSLILISLLGPFLLALLPESLWKETLHLNDGDGPYTETRTRDDLLPGVFLTFFIPLPVAAWILSGTDIPKEGPVPRLIMVFVTAVLGIPAYLTCWAGVVHFRDRIYDSPVAQTPY